MAHLNGNGIPRNGFGLESLASGGLPSPADRLTSARAARVRHSEHELEELLANPGARVSLPTSATPHVSVLVPTHDAAPLLLRALLSLAACTRDVAHEVIIVADRPGETVRALLARVSGATIVENEGPAGFLHACNAGIPRARGEHVALLNDDVEVTPGWLSTLVTALEADPTRGAVGARLVLPDGTLQESGSIVWSNGSATGYGRGLPANAPEALHLREVDFSSAACLLVRRAPLQALGGFDPRFAPAYYEDTDLCFELRARGLSVWVEPGAWVWHHEGGSHLSARATALMRDRRGPFVAKWRDALRSRPAPGEQGSSLRARDRRSGLRVLLVDDVVPDPSLGSGFPRAADMLRGLVALGCVVTLLTTWRERPAGPFGFELRAMGVEVLTGVDPAVVMDDRADGYDVVIISRPHNAIRYLARARARFPGARLIYDAEALACLRDARRAELDGRSTTDAERLRLVREELACAELADVITCVCEVERRWIEAALPRHAVVVWGFIYTPRDDAPGFDERRELLFLGALSSANAPNVDSVTHLVRALLPRISARLPGVTLRLVGREPADEVKALASSRVIVAGGVPDVGPSYEAARVMLIPLRFGAGASYKVGEALAHGVPAVVTPLAAEGFELEHGRGVMIARSDDAFVEHVVELFEDRATWTRVRDAGLAFVRDHCAQAPMRATLARVIGLLPGLTLGPPAPPPDVEPAAIPRAAPVAPPPAPVAVQPFPPEQPPPQQAGPDLTELSARFDAIHHQLVRVYGSNSWRLTAPLRAVRHLLLGPPQR